MRILALTIVAAIAAGPSLALAQTGGTPPSAPAQQNAHTVQLPVSIDRIQKAISRPPAIQPRTDRLVFRVEVFAKKLTIEDILGPDYLRGPVPYGGMTHQEFLNMVTPPEFRGYSVFTNKEGMMVAATSVALQWALLKAVDKLKDARTELAKEAARREVMAAMNELEEARKKAGLAPARPPTP